MPNPGLLVTPPSIDDVLRMLLSTNFQRLTDVLSTLSHADLADLVTGDPHTQYQKESEKNIANGYAGLDAGGLIVDGQIPASITRDAELAAHEADSTGIHGIANTAALVVDGDPAGGVLSGTYPDPGFAVDMATQAELDAHAAAGDPHAGYQKESEKNALSGYPGLDAGGFILESQIPTSIARDAEVIAEIATHAGAADPHTGYQRESEKGMANGYASLDGGVVVPIAQIPWIDTRISDGGITANKKADDMQKAEVLTSQTTTSTSYTNLATVGPTVTVTVGTKGKVLLVLFGLVSNSGANATLMGFDISGATTISPSDSRALQNRVTTAIGIGAAWLLDGLNVGSTTFQAKYRVTAGTGTFVSRAIGVMPL